jgi:hypothetical protein
MLRVLIVLFWVSLLVGTLVAHSVVANWATTLAGLYFGARWFAGRRSTQRTATVQPSPPATEPQTSANGASSSTSPSANLRPRWTMDRVHTTDRRWR